MLPPTSALMNKLSKNQHEISSKQSLLYSTFLFGIFFDSEDGNNTVLKIPG
jgi:uncharacterized membrane protein